MSRPNLLPTLSDSPTRSIRMRFSIHTARPSQALLPTTADWIARSRDDDRDRARELHQYAQEAIVGQNHRMIANDVCKPDGRTGFPKKAPPKRGCQVGGTPSQRDHHSLAESSKCVQIDVAFIPHASDPQARAM
jgi:hypothetical protein